MLNIAIIGNCQSTSLFHYFERSPFVNVTALLDINCQDTPDFEIAKQKVLIERNLDFIISQPLSQNFGELASDNLRQIYQDRFLGLTNIFFTGLHPDLSYFGNFGTRVESPLGDYHSKLALLAFAKQLSVEECLLLYNNDIYEKMGYFQAFYNSKDELIKRDEVNEIKFAEKFFNMTQNQLSLYAVNHPTKEVINELGKMICLHLNVETTDDYGFFYDSLITSTVWPVYPEIKEFHKLSYQASMRFYPHVNKGIKALTLTEFVTKSFEAYNALGYDKFMEVELAHVLNDIAL